MKDEGKQHSTVKIIKKTRCEEEQVSWLHICGFACTDGMGVLRMVGEKESDRGSDLS